ncbi:hypothetical protein MKZ38_007372 [Zalerion maritima]|uniref:SWR1-complex protein 3 domain-containing protein n=1 Tax=Zalerion maritima TaxID=339359 RepID=A0AAD5WMZ5_9PEZI|nr:hypothetical protein MKZ38_007372 [Zalerion maritima]
MERKRKLPARAAARVEHVAKKRNITPPVDSGSKSRSLTPQASGTGSGPGTGARTGGSGASGKDTPSLETQQPSQQPPTQNPLPKSIQPGKALPTVEQPQPEDLPAKEFQSLTESGVLPESLSRSRQKWVDGLFEKYWTKPSKRKGVVENPKNPPKETMHKLGLVTITVEPHVFEATMYTVKDPRPEPPTPTTRPHLQYGPPNGVMPPSATPRSATPATPSAAATVPALSTSESQAATASKTAEKSATPSEDLTTKVKTEPGTEQPAQPAPPLQLPQAAATATADTAPGLSAVAAPTRPITSPRGMESVLSPPLAPSTHTGGPAAASQQLGTSTAPRPPTGSTNPSPALSIASITTPVPAAGPAQAVTVRPSPTAATSSSSRPATANASSAAQRPGADPIIVTLAEKASADPFLRELMKRVASGDAQKDELAHFQKIIDQITAEHKLKGGEQGPSAGRLIVGGKSVKYYSDEVNSILSIVLRSNPRQRGVDLKPPINSNPLIIALLRKALDDTATKEMVQRISEGKARFSDATDLKAILDSLKTAIVSDVKATNLKEKGPMAVKVSQPQPQLQPSAPSASSSQALRSKGPPPPPPIKRDISNVVFEFAGGSGDRYLFPKFSILEPQNGGQQVIASFLIVRKGSTSDYGGDPTLDYYQPVTVRVFAHSAKHLEALQKVVAPRDEAQRYMENIMDNMTRAEYVLLAMRLPKEENKDESRNVTADSGTMLNGNQNAGGNGNGNGIASGVNTPKTEPGLAPGGPAIIHQPTPPAVLWKVTPPPLRPSPVVRKAVNAVGADDDGGYQNLISKVAKKTEEVA